MPVIIIAGYEEQAKRYAKSHGIKWTDVAYNRPALGCHYERLILVGSYFRLSNIQSLIDNALVAVWRFVVKRS